MKKTTLFFLLIALFWGYNNKTKEENGNTANNNEQISKTDSTKKLKYLFSANGGLIGFFDDGSVADYLHYDLMD